MNLYFKLPLLLLILVFFGCEREKNHPQPWTEPNGKVKALATVQMIADLLVQVAGDEADVQVLIKGDLNPHSYQLVKGDDEKLRYADLIFANGLGLEHGPSLKYYLENDPKSVFLGDMIMAANPELLLTCSGQSDPHIWMDISIWAKTVPLLVNALSDKRPDKKEYFKKRGELLIQELMENDEKIRTFLLEIPSEFRFLVTSHDAFNYFTRAYFKEPGESNWKIRFQAPEGLSPESQLCLHDLREIINHLKKYHIKVIFPESNLNYDSLKKIVSSAKEEGLDVRLGSPYLYGDAMGPKGSDGDTYLKMIWHNAKTLKADLWQTP